MAPRFAWGGSPRDGVSSPGFPIRSRRVRPSPQVFQSSAKESVARRNVSEQKGAAAGTANASKTSTRTSGRASRDPPPPAPEARAAAAGPTSELDGRAGASVSPRGVSATSRGERRVRLDMGQADPRSAWWLPSCRGRERYPCRGSLPEARPCREETGAPVVLRELSESYPRADDTWPGVGRRGQIVGEVVRTSRGGPRSTRDLRFSCTLGARPSEDESDSCSMHLGALLDEDIRGG